MVIGIGAVGGRRPVIVLENKHLQSGQKGRSGVLLFICRYQQAENLHPRIFFATLAPNDQPSSALADDGRQVDISHYD